MSETFLDPAAIADTTFGAKFDAVILERKCNLLAVHSLRQDFLRPGHDGSVDERFLIILVGVRKKCQSTDPPKIAETIWVKPLF